VLFVGGGGFSGPKRFLEEYDATVDVVEIDPGVVRVAREYFRVPESDRLNVYTRDGRKHLRETDHTYDLIVLDAYRRDKVPFHMTTVEFMRLANDRLSSDGVLVANLISAPVGPAPDFYRAEHRTISRVFPQVYSFPTAGGSVVQNVEIVATKNDARVTGATLQERNDRRDVGLGLETEVDAYRRREPDPEAPVLRDDYAPVDSLLDPMVGRRYVVERTGENRTATPGSAR